MRELGISGVRRGRPKRTTVAAEAAARPELTGDDGLLTALVRQVLQKGLEVEMTDHLGYQPYAVEGRSTGNSRNGAYPKTVTTDIGLVDLQVPRDRNSTFDPVTVPKGQRRLDNQLSAVHGIGVLRDIRNPVAPPAT